MAATLDGLEGNRRCFRGQVHVTLVVRGEGGCREAHGPTPAQHAGRGHQEMGAFHH
jgi:hypothetical protein